MKTATGWRHRLLQEGKFLLKTARPGFWSTTIWFYFLPLGQRAVFDRAGFWLGLACVTFPLGLLIYGWNDLVDAETDRVNPRKDTFLFGARPTPEQRRRLPWWIAAVQAPFLGLIALQVGVGRAVAWYAVMVVAVALYNQPPFSWKSRPPLEVLNQAGYLVVFVLSSWLNQVPQLPWPAFVFGALFAMHSHLFGEIMDLAPDRQAGRRTTATLLGAVAAKGLIAALLAVEAVLVWGFFRAGGITFFLAASAAWFVADACLLWRHRPYTPWQMRTFFLGWNAIAIGSLLWMWREASLTHLV